MISRRERSAYSIYSELNDGETDNGKGRKLNGIVGPHTDSMSYKNVHKRVKRLETLGLIEQLPERRPKEREIKYRLTSRGLFQELLDYPWPDFTQTGHRVVVLPLVYKDDIILQTILYQYFELETVKEFMEIFGDLFFNGFIMKCCEEIQEIVDGISTSFEVDFNPNLKKEWPYYYSEKYGFLFNLDSWSGDRIGKQIDGIIRNEAKNLIYEILRESTNVPKPVLVADKKFIELLEEVKKEFNEGLKNIIY